MSDGSLKTGWRYVSIISIYSIQKQTILVEGVLSRQHKLSESTKDNIRSRVTSTLQSASLPNSNLTPDGQKALKQLKTDENIVILPADKGWVTVVMDKTDYNDKMESLVSDKQPYEVLKGDPKPALQRKLNNKTAYTKENLQDRLSTLQQTEV